MADDLDARVRLAAFAFLEEHVRVLDAVLPFALLSHGFVFAGQRVPLLNAVRGIFKPSVLQEMPLSITTSPPRDGQQRPCDDVMTPSGLPYRYQGSNPQNGDNVRLRLAIRSSATGRGPDRQQCGASGGIGH